MRQNRINILVAEPTPIIRRGLVSMLLDIKSFGVNVGEVDDLNLLHKKIISEKPDFVITNPLHWGMNHPASMLPKDCNVRFIALQTHLSYDNKFKNYLTILSIVDSIQDIEEKLMKIVNADHIYDESGLSLREREVIIAIAKGATTKDIAEQLCLSIHTVMTHRKNIASKLKIHNQAGITIYAIVNKLIEINDIE